MRRAFERLLALLSWLPLAAAAARRADVPRGSRDIARQARIAEERRLLGSDRQAESRVGHADPGPQQRGGRS